MGKRQLKVTALILVLSLFAAVFAISAFAAETPEITIGSWGYEAKAAGNAFAAVIKAIAQSEKVYVAVTKKTLPIAQEKLFGENKNVDIMHQDNIELFFADTDDAWARDVAPTFVKSNAHHIVNSNQESSDQNSGSASDSVIRAVNWEFNAWGGNVDGLYASWEKDNAFASAFADQFGFD